MLETNFVDFRRFMGIFRII